MAIVRGDNVVGRIDCSVIGEEYAMGRVVGRSGSVIDGVSCDRVVGRAIDINSMSTASEDVIAGYHVVDRGTASVIESDTLTRRPCNCVSGDDVVLGDVRAVADNDAPAVAVEVVAWYCIPLSSEDVDSVVCAREDRIAGYRFTSSTAQVETIAVASAHVAGHRVVVASTVVHAVTVRCENISGDRVVL